jgi:hypothetical protein
MSRPALAAALAVLLSPCLAAAQEPAATPTGFVATFALGGGAELGLDEDEPKAGVVEVEASIGYELEALGVRPEIAVVFAPRPDSHVALRPGLRWSAPELPVQLRIAFDASDARGEDFGWRWLLVGVAAELRFTSLLGLFAEVDTGIPLADSAGVPLLVRGGASFRF